jgi:hypothetical protein
VCSIADLCEYCIKRKRKVKPPEPRWRISWLQEKNCPVIDVDLGADYASQLVVYHVDGNQHNTSLRKFKNCCLNCVEEIKRLDRPWQPGDLEPDR